MSLGLLILLNVVLQTTASYVEQQRRRNYVLKWAKGELSMKELLWLKRQLWFQKAFHPVSVEKEKKTN